MRVATALSPYHRQLLAAERRMFASPRLRAVICNSRMVREEIQRWFGVSPERLHVIYNGVDPARFDDAVLRDDTRARLRDELALPHDAPVATCVARLHPVKDHPTLVRAFGHAAASVPDARLLLVGAVAAAVLFLLIYLVWLAIA